MYIQPSASLLLLSSIVGVIVQIVVASNSMEIHPLGGGYWQKEFLGWSPRPHNVSFHPEQNKFLLKEQSVNSTKGICRTNEVFPNIFSLMNCTSYDLVHKKVDVGTFHRMIFAIFSSRKPHSVEVGKSPFCGLIQQAQIPAKAGVGKMLWHQLCKVASFCQHSTLQIVVKQAWCVTDFSFIFCNLPVILLNSMFLQTSASP